MNAKSFSFQGTFKHLKGITTKSISETSDDVLEMLSRAVSVGSRYKKGQGIAPVDYFRRKSRSAGQASMAQWRKRLRKSSNGKTTVQFTNKSSYATYLYKDTPSIGKSGYRSGGKHNKLSNYERSNATSSYRERPSQLTRKKWESFKKFALLELKTNVLGDIKSVRK